jgi:hypothetical protein
MNDTSSTPLSRRQWVGLTMPVLAASLGAGLIGASRASAAEPPAGPAGDATTAGTRVYNVRDFGAKGDGATLDTAAIQAAIDACNRDHGGIVLLPAGDFLSGTIELKSNVTLHLAAAGRLLGSGKIEDYHAGNGLPRNNGNVVLISAANAENITLEGHGTIDGQGAKFYTGHGDSTGPGDDRSKAYVDRPHLMTFYRCKNLVVRDVFCTSSAYHCMRIYECMYVQLEGVRIHNRVNKNNDGFHFDSSQYVHVANCDVACQDDACALFGSCKFITVTNCTFSTRWSVFRFGGGQAENITVSNCVIYETYGCPIKMHFGRNSRAENITFSNLIMKDVTGPISLGLDARARRRPDSDSTPPPKGILRNITFSGIRATVVGTVRQHADLPFPSEGRPGETRTCIVLNGATEDCILENICLSDVHVIYEGGGTAEEAARRDVPPVAGEYFEIGTPPAYGLFARNVHGLTLQNIRFEVTSPDLRPAVVLDHVADAAINGLSVQGHEKAESVLRLIATRDTLLTATRVLTPSPVFLQLEGAANDNITVDGGDLTKAAAPLAFKSGATEKAVKLRA